MPTAHRRPKREIRERGRRGVSEGARSKTHRLWGPLRVEKNDGCRQLPVPPVEIWSSIRFPFRKVLSARNTLHSVQRHAGMGPALLRRGSIEGAGTREKRSREPSDDGTDRNRMTGRSLGCYILSKTSRNAKRQKLVYASGTHNGTL